MMVDVLEIIERGPLPQRMDLWLEHSRFFHGFHEQFIGDIGVTLTKALARMGYRIVRETSLQITDGGSPDLFIKQISPRSRLPYNNYELAAAEVLAEPGIASPDTPPETALHIYDMASQDLVTVIEVVSPGNKTSDEAISRYRQRRQDVFFAQGVNMIEIDLTRSLKRLTLNEITRSSPYHVAILMPGYDTRTVPLALSQPFKRIALPLRDAVIALDLQTVYHKTYHEFNFAFILYGENFYTLANLPFPTLLTDAERDEALAAVAAWQAAIQKFHM